MKKTLKVLTIVTVLAIMFASLCSCFFPVDMSTEESNDSTVEDNNTPAGNNSATTETKDNNSGSDNKKVTINETVCLDYNGLKITATELEDGSALFSSEGLKVKIENNSTTDYGIGIKQLYVNDCIVNTFFSQTVSAGKKANDTISFSSTDLDNAKIDTIGRIEIYFYLYHPTEYTTIYSAPAVTINTSASGNVKNNVKDLGETVYNKGGFVIKCLETKDQGLSGGEVLFYVENNTKNIVSFSIDELSVNGYMCTDLFVVSDVASGKYATNTLDIYASTMEENNIEKIENIAFKFHIYDSTSYQET